VLVMRKLRLCETRKRMREDNEGMQSPLETQKHIIFLSFILLIFRFIIYVVRCMINEKIYSLIFQGLM